MVVDSIVAPDGRFSTVVCISITGCSLMTGGSCGGEGGGGGAGGG